MKRRTITILALVAALTVAVAAPVSAGADKPISGKMELTLTLTGCPPASPNGPVDPSGGLPITWIGTVEIDGVTYGWADFSIDFYIEGNFGYFEEFWTIFDLGDDGAVTVEKVCNDDLVLIQGFNDGWGSTQGNVGKADGFVTDASEDGPFAGVAPGSRMMWRGKVTTPPPNGPGSLFKATFHIYPLD